MNKETINSLRKYYDLPVHVSDEEIESKLKGSLGYALVNLEAAKQNFKQALIKEMTMNKRFTDHGLKLTHHGMFFIGWLLFIGLIIWFIS